MATTITKTETAGRQAHPPARGSAPDHRHGDLRRRHQDAGHALCRDRAQPARGGEDSLHRHRARPQRFRASLRCSPVSDTEHVGPVPCGASLPGLRVPHHHILATDRVYFVGHPVAVVVATDRYIARDAADLVEVDWEVGTAVADPEKALAPGAPAVHPQWPDNKAFNFHQEGGEVDKAFAEADVVVKQRITSQRLIPTAMETRGVVAEWRAADRALNLYSSTQIPHLVRTLVAMMLGLEENRLRVVAPEVGGGFGSKLNIYAEEALMGFVAMKIGKPVKWIESRRENFLCTIHGRGHVDYYEIAAKKDGTIPGIKLKIIQDLGAYHQLLTPAIPTLSVLMMPGLYRTQNIRADIVGVFTNCVPTDAYRGAGRPEATHGIERMVDILAAELKMDPAEIRLKNFIQKSEFPFPTATGLIYDSGDYAAPLKKAMATAGYEELRAEQAEARKQGKLMGIGISTYGEICAMGPSPATPAGGWESATVKIEPSGKVTVLTGCSPHGQGEETTFAQIAADELGVRYRRRTGGARRYFAGAVRHRNVRQPRDGGRRHGAVFRACRI